MLALASRFPGAQARYWALAELGRSVRNLSPLRGSQILITPLRIAPVASRELSSLKATPTAPGILASSRPVRGSRIREWRLSPIATSEPSGL